MAIDDWLLDQVVQRRQGAVLRLYHWSAPTLSLGYHQHALPPAWRTAAAQGRISMVRRPSGGSAVLHAGSLTYAIVWPDPPRQRQQAYALISAWLSEALASTGLRLRPGAATAGAPASSCFATSTSADLVQRDGQKRIGSAQLWRRRQLLQHGSVVMDPPPELWQELFGASPPTAPGASWRPDRLETALWNAALDLLGGGPLIPDPLRAWEWAAIDRRRHRFRLSGVATAAGEPDAG
jgi:lipoate-protein ligase A